MNAKLYPTLRFRDADAGLQFLKDAFGFEEHEVYRGDDGRVRHAELTLGDDMIMFGEGEPGTGGGIYAAVEDVEGLYARAKAAGAEITRELADTDYGSRGFSCRDLDGHEWSFGTYRPTRE
jgi:uncharacterized glyoxalase superfamily protein PhnB